LRHSQIEALATKILSQVEAFRERVPLMKIIELENRRNNLQVNFNAPVIPPTSMGALGKITFQSSKTTIDIFISEAEQEGRFRFTLAHELAHYFLNHGEFMVTETFNPDHYLWLSKKEGNMSAINRLEFQANIFSSCLLMPKESFKSVFFRILDNQNTRTRKGGAPLYVDDQPCNIATLQSILDTLSETFGVSKQAAEIRLKNLRLLQDSRTGFKTIHRFLA
jgi:Zn-dependent peptidase ImmA (M78 family)